MHDLPSMRNGTHDVWVLNSARRSERPRYVIIGFHIDKRNKLNTDVSEFDHCNMVNVKLFNNSVQSPYDNMNLKIPTDCFLAYQMYANFQSGFYNKRNEPNLTFEEYLKKMLFVFDVSKQNESVKASTVDLKIEFEASAPFPPNTRAYCLIISDAIVEYTPLTGFVRRIVD